ncbi:hypothetical protein FOCC_FOCC001682 [Frankliniella occidentalis]|nr:hypothetical protein FOCC_FOCC001682 [Frankliniella occidentalis]
MGYFTYRLNKWLYRRNYNDELQRHNKASASFHALKDAMDKQQEEFDIQKLRAAYYKEMGHGPIGMHLVPALIRTKLPTPQSEEIDSKMGESVESLKDKKPAGIK